MATFTSQDHSAYRRLVGLLLSFVLAVVPLASASAQSVGETLRDFEDRWAHAVFESKGREQARALSKLLKDTREFARSHDESPDAAAWHGIVAHECLRAGCKSAQGSLRKEARDALQKADSLDPYVLDGRAAAHLGALYARTSSSFGGFGSSVKGIGYLWRALVIDPDCLDSNYLYAELLVEEKNLAEARNILRKAMATPARQEHFVADRGLHRQIRDLLAAVESRLRKSG